VPKKKKKNKKLKEPKSQIKIKIINFSHEVQLSLDQQWRSENLVFNLVVLLRNLM
jgi:hypothetical protein